ncbi:MAG: LysE family translocator [Geminicoccaceae bacterium]
MSWAALLAFWGAFALALMSPGPNFALMLRIGLASGRAAALRTTLGIAVGEAVWGFAALFGVAALALRYPMLATAIRWAGGMFLLWLAWGALRSAWRGPGLAGEPATDDAGGGFWTGLALMLLNAKAGFFWVSLTGVLLGAELPAGAVLLTVAVCVLLSLLWHGLLALAFSGRRVTRLYARLQRGIEGVLGAALAALGLRLLAAS